MFRPYASILKQSNIHNFHIDIEQFREQNCCTYFYLYLTIIHFSTIYMISITYLARKRDI